MFWIGGRLAWPLVLSVLVSTLALLATDLIWRFVNTSFLVIVALGAILLLASNAAVFFLAARSR